MNNQEVKELINRIATYMRVRFPGCQSWIQRSEDGRYYFIYLRQGDLEKRIAFSSEELLLAHNQEAEIDHLGNQLAFKRKKGERNIAELANTLRTSPDHEVQKALRDFQAAVEEEVTEKVVIILQETLEKIRAAATGEQDEA